MEQQNNLRIIFTKKANLAFDSLINNFNLEESPDEFSKRIGQKKTSKKVTVDRLIKDFAKGILLEKDLVNSLQKDLEVSQQIAEQISKEIITKIVPFLEKIPEEKFKNPVFVEEISKKIFETVSETKKERVGEKEMDIFPRVKPPTDIIEQPNKNISMPIEEPTDNITVPSTKSRVKRGSTTELGQPRIKKPIISEEIGESISQPKQKKGPDSYREPIE